MMAWNRTRTLIAGMGLILLTNLIALGGIAYNRGAAESTLKLGQRELGLPYNWGFVKENSGLALSLQWRVLGDESGGGFYMPQFRGGAPAWLDKAKLAELGFDVSRAESNAQDSRHYDKQLAREVLLVLELDGEAYQAALQRARQHAVEEAAAQQANPNNKSYEQRAKNAQEQLDREEHEYSRLFVIDAGLDQTALRAKYPDRAKYAIVRGTVRPQMVSHEHKARLLGYVSTLSVNDIHVPLGFLPVFEPMLQSGRPYGRNIAAPFEVSVAFGKRLEPWVIGAQKN